MHQAQQLLGLALSSSLHLAATVLAAQQALPLPCPATAAGRKVRATSYLSLSKQNLWMLARAQARAQGPSLVSLSPLVALRRPSSTACPTHPMGQCLDAGHRTDQEHARSLRALGLSDLGRGLGPAAARWGPRRRSPQGLLRFHACDDLPALLRGSFACRAWSYRLQRQGRFRLLAAVTWAASPGQEDCVQSLNP